MTDAKRDATRTTPSRATREEERVDARRPPGPDREPTPEELELADDLEIDPEVEKHYKEMTERGAHQRGEGRISS